MKVAVEMEGEFRILHLQGEFDSFACKPFLEKVEELIERGTSGMAINLRKIKFINSTALGTLIKASKTLKRQKGSLVLSSPSAVVKGVLDSLGLARILPTYENDEAAIAALQGDEISPAAEAGDVPEEERSSVLFSPTDAAIVEKYLPKKDRLQAPSKIHGHAFGQNWRGVGRMSSLDEDGIRFTWDGGGTKLDANGMKAMLASGTEMGVKFRLPLLQWRLSDATVEVADVVDHADGIEVTTKFVEIAAKTLEAVRQYVKDMAFLKSELDKAREKPSSG